jgi:hypothetical protein
MPCLLGRPDNECIPGAVKVDIVSKYLYRDVGQHLLGQHMDDRLFIFSLYRSLKPRMYLANEVDSIIVEEGQYVEEALLV